MEDEHKRTLSMYNAADRLVRTPDAKNVYRKLLGLGVIVPVIGTTKDGGIVQAYANGEDLRKSATCATQEGLLTQIDDELRQILQDSVKSNMKAEAMKMICSKTFWDKVKDLTEKLFNEATDNSKPDIKTLVEKCLPEDNQVKSLVDAKKFQLDYRKIESLVKNIRNNRRIDFFNEHGFPRNPQQAIRVLCSFFYALVTLHELGYVHCDLKPDNVILTQDKIGTKNNTVLKLIDLGALTPIGERIGTHSNNGAPEVSHSSGIYEKPILIAQPSYDIYCTTGIILGCLFGYSGIQADNNNFWPETMVGNSAYVRLLQNHNFRNETDGHRFEFFRQMTHDLNTSMGQYGANYPDDVLNIITTILYWMTEPDWQLRPSAIDILERLQELALSDWSSKNFQIQVPKRQALQKDNQMPPLQPQKKSKKSFLKRIFTVHRRE